MHTRATPVEVLLVEDDAASARLVREALKEVRVDLNVSVAQDGEQALAILRRQGDSATAPQPDFILLDLNLPKKDGFTVLAELKEDPALKRIPVVVLTTSTAPADIRRGYDLHANCYIVKPGSLAQYITAIRSITDFWLTTVTLPSV